MEGWQDASAGNHRRYKTYLAHAARFLSAAYAKISPAILGALLRIGLPTGIQFVMVSLAELAVITFVNHFGSTPTAAYGAVNQVVSYVQFPALSIGITASIFGAQSIGAKRFDRLSGIVRSGVILNYAIGGFLITVAYLFNDAILGTFVRDAHSLAIAHDLLSVTLWSYVIFGNNAVLSDVMRSSGAVLWPTLISITSIWAVEVPVAYVLSQRTSIGLSGVWYAYPVAFIFGLTCQTMYYWFFSRNCRITPLSV